jgi:type I restriction enzyme S subunit
MKKGGKLEGWKVEKLSDVCEVFADGDWIESKDQSPDGVRLIQTGNVGNGIFKDRGEKARYISEATFKRLRCTEIFEGDCLVSRLPDPVGRACILPDTGEKMITAVDCTIIRFDKQKVIPEFFNYYSQSDQYINDVDHETSGTTRKRISRSKLAEIEIPIPPLPEQQRIVHVLDEAFASIAQAKSNAERNLVNARELFETVLETAFDNSDWEEKRLDEICEVKDGTHDTPQYEEDGIPFVTQKNIREDGLSFDNTKFIALSDHEKYYKRSNVFFGDILISMIGANRGMACLVDDKRVFSIKNVGLIKSSKNINQSYLLYFLKSPKAKKYISTNSKGGAQEFIGLTELRKFPILFAPLTEQRAIVGRLEALSAETGRLEEIYEAKVEGLEELKKSVLGKAFGGEL